MMSHDLLVQMAYWAIAINILTLPPLPVEDLPFLLTPVDLKQITFTPEEVHQI